MPPIENVLFELGSFALGIAVLLKLWAEPNKFHFVGFFIAILMTATVELFGVREMNSYFYSQFWFYIHELDPALVAQIGGTARDFPVFVGVDWAIIMFCLWRLGERLELNWYLIPIVFGLISVFVDLALDPLASASRTVSEAGVACTDSTLPIPPIHADGIGYWVWCVPPQQTEFWLGVPLANSYGWFLVVSVFTFFYFLAYQIAYNSSLWIQIATLFSAMLAALLVFFTFLLWLLSLNLGVSGWLLLGLMMLAGVVVLWMAGMNRKRYDIDLWSLAAVLSIVALCLGLYVFKLSGSLSLLTSALVGLCLIVSVLLTLWTMIGKRLIGQPYP